MINSYKLMFIVNLYIAQLLVFVNKKLMFIINNCVYTKEKASEMYTDA